MSTPCSCETEQVHIFSDEEELADVLERNLFGLGGWNTEAIEYAKATAVLERTWPGWDYAFSGTASWVSIALEVLFKYDVGTANRDSEVIAKELATHLVNNGYLAGPQPDNGDYVLCSCCRAWVHPEYPTVRWGIHHGWSACGVGMYSTMVLR